MGLGAPRACQPLRGVTVPTSGQVARWRRLLRRHLPLNGEDFGFAGPVRLKGEDCENNDVLPLKGSLLITLPSGCL